MPSPLEIIYTYGDSMHLLTELSNLLHLCMQVNAVTLLALTKLNAVQLSSAQTTLPNQAEISIRT